MTLRNVTVDGKKMEAWICDECGYAHVRKPSSGRATGASGASAGRAAGKKIGCAKKIRITRKAHERNDGTPVRATTYYACDPGRPGRRTRGSKVGPYREHPKWTTGAGKLGGRGFTQRSERDRRAIITDAVGFYGYASTTRMLRIIIQSTTVAAETRTRIESDLAWMKKKWRGKPH